MKLVLLDRDGVLNRDHPQSVLRPERLEMLPGAAEGVALLTKAGFKTAIVTNQSAVGMGNLAPAMLDTIHAHLKTHVEEAGGRIDAVYYCPAPPGSNHPDRKPNPGMLLRALSDFGAEAARTPMVGDMLRDLEAAKAAGCPRILVKTGKGELTLRQGLPKSIGEVSIYGSLLEAAQAIVAGHG